MPGFYKAFSVQVDASEIAAGAVLLQVNQEWSAAPHQVQDLETILHMEEEANALFFDIENSIFYIGIWREKGPWIW